MRTDHNGSGIHICIAGVAKVNAMLHTVQAEAPNRRHDVIRVGGVAGLQSAVGEKTGLKPGDMTESVLCTAT